MYLYKTYDLNHNHRISCTVSWVFILADFGEEQDYTSYTTNFIHILNLERYFPFTLVVKQNVLFKQLNYWIIALKQNIRVLLPQTQLGYWQVISTFINTYQICFCVKLQQDHQQYKIHIQVSSETITFSN